MLMFSHLTDCKLSSPEATSQLFLVCVLGRGFDSHQGQKIFSLPRVVP